MEVAGHAGYVVALVFNGSKGLRNIVIKEAQGCW